MESDLEWRCCGRSPSPSNSERRFHLFSAWLGTLLLLSSWAATGQARDYSVEVRVADEGELRQLYYDGLLDDEELELLLRLLESPVDINQAEASDLLPLPGVTPALAEQIIEERDTDGAFASMIDLHARVEGVNESLKDQLSAFVIAHHRKDSRAPARGYVDLLMLKELRAVEPIVDDYPALGHSAGQLGYDKWPSIGLGAGVSVKDWLSIGVAGLAQEGLKAAAYDPNSGDVFAAYGTPVFRPYMGYAKFSLSTGEAVLGSYHLHYGQGLVMSSLGGRGRHGFYLRRGIGQGNDRIREFDGLLGAAARTTALRAGTVRFDLSAFASLRTYDQYISFVGLAAGEQLDAATAEVEAPRVWVDGKRASYMTLPNVFRVGLVGGNFTARFNRRTHLGFTGYGASMDRTTLPGVEDPHTFLIRQRWPSDTGFGALGINGRIGLGLLSVAGEWGLWLAQNPANAFFVRAQLEPLWGVISLSLRHYDTAYGNPMARAEAAPDRYAGNSARNEQGLRLQATLRPNKSLRVNLRLDISRNITFDVTDASLRGSVTGRPTEWLQLRFFGDYVNQNVLVNGPEQRYGGSFDEEVFGLAADDELELEDGSYERAGEHIRVGGSVRLKHARVGSLVVRYSHSFQDTGKEIPGSGGACELVKQSSHRLRIQGRLYPSRTTRLVTSFSYEDDDVAGSKGSRGLETYVQLQQGINERLQLRVRGRVGRYLPDPPNDCDFGGDSAYTPDDYDLRHFGELLFTARVKF